jgi:hypothetical protein
MAIKSTLPVFQSASVAAGETEQVHQVTLKNPLTPDQIQDIDEGKSRIIDLRESVENYNDRDLLFLALAILTGELHYPAYMLEYSLKEIQDPGTMKLTELQYVRSITRRVILAEGDVHLSSLKWYGITSIGLLTLACLTSASIGISWFPGHGTHAPFGMGHEVLIPFYLVSAFSLGRLDRKLVLFGWRRLRRLSWVRLSPSPFRTRWRALVRTLGDSDSMRKER